MQCSVAQLCPTLLQPQGPQPTRILCPWNSPGKNTRVDCHFLLQGIFPTQGLNSCLLQMFPIIAYYEILSIISLYNKSLLLIYLYIIVCIYIFKFYFIFKLYNIVLVLPYIEMNPPQAYMCYPLLFPFSFGNHKFVFHESVSIL